MASQREVLEQLKRLVTASFLYAATTSDSFVRYLTVNSHGSAYPAVRANIFERAEFAVPSAGLLEAFDNIGRPIRARVASNDDESNVLASLRDLLLPKLLSGEIRVKQAEKAIEEVL